MAPALASEYFPPLDKCLNGDDWLISWKTAFIGVSSLDPTLPRDTLLERFLSDPHSRHLLSRPFTAYDKPTPQSRVQFDSRTSAINTTTSEASRKLIGQLQEDALWLSRSVQVDEVSALRVAVLEWQSRLEAQLFAGFSEEESASIQDVTAAQGLGSSMSLSTISVVPAFFSTSNVDLGSERKRRVRLIQTYLLERRHFLKITEVLVRAGLSDTIWTSEGNASATWLEGIGKTILNTRCSGFDSFSGSEAFLLEAVNALRQCVLGLMNGVTGIVEDDEDDTDSIVIDVDWRKAHLLDMIHAMQIFFSIIDATNDIPPSSILLAWLRLVGEHSFFNGVFFPVDSLQAFVPTLRTLVAAISLALLKLPRVLDLILNPSDPPQLASPTARPPFILEVATVSEANTIFLAAAGAEVTTAGPAVLAWSIILQTIRENSAPKLRQALPAEDSVPDAASPLPDDGFSMSAQEGSRPTPARLNSERNSGSSAFDAVLQSCVKKDDPSDPDPIHYLAEWATDGGQVFEFIFDMVAQLSKSFATEGRGEAATRMRMVLLELIRVSLAWVQYSPEVVAASLAVLSGNESFWELTARPKLPQALDPVAVFLDDSDLLMPNLLGAAIARFPFETGPLLQLLRVLSVSLKCDSQGTLSAVTALGGFHLFTQAFPDGFRDYDLAQDEENNNFLVLTSAIPIFAQRGTRNQFLNGSANSLALESPHGNRTEDADMIPAGTQGRVVLEPSPFVVQWAHRFSCLRYLGRILESSLPSSEVVSVFAVDRNTLAEIIDLLAVLLTSSRRVSETGDDASNASAHGVLAETSEGIGRRNGDVIAVIFDLFENGIQDSLRPMAVDGTMDLLSSCTHFIFALTSILPGRVWPFFARSGLLEMNGLGGKFADIVASTEIIIGRFEFTIGCIHVFEALVDEAVVHAVARRATSKAVTRFSGVDRLGTGVPAQVMGRVLLAFERAILDVLASFSGWRYDVMDEKLEIGARILSIFEKIIIYTQGADDSANTDLKATAMLEPAAASLLDFFLSQGSSNAPINPLLRIFSDGMTSPHSTVFLGTSRLWTQQTVAALNFCTTLLRVGILRQRSGSRIGVQLFKLLPFFVRMYGAVEAYKQPVVSLLEAMVLTVASPEEEPPSILAHLGPATAKSFVGLLSRFSKPLEDENLDVAIWNLMSAAVSNRQQWFAIQLLTGKAPKESLRKSTEEPTVEPNGRKPVLVHALDRLTTLKELPPREAAAMAEFLALAGDYWPWSIAEAKRRPNLLRCFADYLGGLDVQIPPTNAAKAKEICNTLQMASLILEFLAIYIHHNAQEGDTSFAKELLPKLGYLKENAVTVRGYNHSLHTNLKKNFEARFPGCSLSFFKRTQLRKAEFGGNYLYDIELAQRMLEYDSSWLGGKGSSGLAGEFERANLNMSVVEAQVLLFYSWRVLLLELSAVIPTETALQEVMVRVVHGGLRSSQRPDLPEFVSARLAPVRMDLVFVLMQKLAEVRSTVPEMKTVLFTAWTAIKRSDVAFELAVSGGDVTYYRPLLRILLLSLQAHADGNAAPPSRGANSVGPSDGSANGGSARLPSSAASELQLTILDVLDVVVIRGFRSLAIRIHDRAGDSSPEDMALVTAILQTALDVQRLTDGTGYHAQQISNRFAEQGTARVASTLFSWSDRLAPAGSDGDPIYGELAMLFLLALSSLPWMAEHLAVDGVLTQISNGSATDPLRRPGALRQPITDPRALRLYSIWQRALLPLCLNLLRAVGAGIAPDVAHFLNQFAPQLRQASSHSFDTKPLASLATSTSAPRTRSALVAPIITAGMTSEAHSLALLHRILHGFRAAGSAAGLLPADIPPLQDWDGPALRDDVEYWLANRDLLRDRLWPVGPAEEDMARAKPTDGCAGAESAFEQRVVADLRAVVALLS